jgi:hypothetical protein
MGQFLQTNGDYNIKTREGGKIVLDTGDRSVGGEVVITGNLTVQGETVYVEATELNVEDRIITVNAGETGAGITGIQKYAGLEVERGTLPNVDFLWSEDSTSWELRQFIFNSSLGETAFVNSRLRVAEILTDFATDGGNLKFLGSESADGVLHVSGTTNYRQNVEDFGPDAIPNKDYVDFAIENNPTFQITRTDTRIIAFDISDPLDPPPSIENPIGPFQAQPAESLIAVVVDNQRAATFYSNRLTLGTYLNVFDETPTDPLNFDDANAVVIQANFTDANIKLETTGTGRVEITYALQLNNQNVSPTVIPETTMVYAGNLGSGKTGLYHNTYYQNVSESVSGELVNKQRALLFAMIF